MTLRPTPPALREVTDQLATVRMIQTIIGRELELPDLLTQVRDLCQAQLDRVYPMTEGPALGQF